jgi:hypothetical protein
MSRNGSGTYVLPAGNPVVTGTTITSNWANTTFSDVATALTGSVAADGQTPMTGPLQMTNNKITGVANGTASTDVATIGQISNPNITGGSIDNTPIGNISPSTGKFTTLSANGGATLTGTCTAPTVTPGSDNTTKIATTAFVQSAISAVSAGVTSFNSRTGVVTLSSSDVTGALGYTPYNAAGTTVINTGNISSYAPSTTGTGATGNWGINITGNAATVTNGVYTTGTQTIAGVKTFTNTATFDGGLTISSASNAIFYNSAINTNISYSGTTYTLSAGGNLAASFTGSGGAYQGNNSSTWSTTSDINVKTNIRPITNVLSKISALKPCHFEYKDEIGKTQSGFIAQEFETVFPGHVSQIDVPKKYQAYIPSGQKIKGIDQNLMPYLVQAIQELKAELDIAKAEIATLKG